jgi:alpha-tubulin suppressor-like RCC1 family protein
MSALDVLRQIKQARRAEAGHARVVEWGNAEYINSIGVDNLTRKELRNHLEARDLETNGTRLELLEKLRSSLLDEQLHKFAYVETLDTELAIEADLEERGSVYVTGANNKGQLGLGDKDPRKFFTVIRPLRGLSVVYVVCGQDLCYAVTEEHDVYVWGGAGAGRTGLNMANMRRRPTEAEPVNNWMEPQIVADLAGEEVSEIRVGSSHNIAVGRGGDCFVWGDSDAGQLGLGSLQSKPNVCINNSFPAVLQVSAGANHTSVLTKTGAVYMWGHGSSGRLGVGETDRFGVPDNERHFFPVPLLLNTLEPIQEVSCGTDHTVARGRAGVWVWGNGSGGKLGLGDNNDRLQPALIPQLRAKSILQVAAGFWHSMAVVGYPPMLGGGWLYTWGSGYHGQLAQGSKVVSMVPEVCEHFVGVHLLVTKCFAGSHHCLAITQDQELYSWGSNNFGCLGRKIDEKDVFFTATPGHVPGFGSLVGRVGRGFARSVSCGREFTVVATFAYEGPDNKIATKLMEEAKIREQELLLQGVGR